MLPWSSYDSEGGDKPELDGLQGLKTAFCKKK